MWFLNDRRILDSISFLPSFSFVLLFVILILSYRLGLIMEVTILLSSASYSWYIVWWSRRWCFDDSTPCKFHFFIVNVGLNDAACWWLGYLYDDTNNYATRICPWFGTKIGTMAGVTTDGFSVMKRKWRKWSHAILVRPSTTAAARQLADFALLLTPGCRFQLLLSWSQSGSGSGCLLGEPCCICSLPGLSKAANGSRDEWSRIHYRCFDHGR